MISKKFKKLIQELLSMFFMIKKEKKYILLIFQNIMKSDSNCEKQVILLMVSLKGWHYIAVKK